MSALALLAVRALLVLGASGLLFFLWQRKRLAFCVPLLILFVLLRWVGAKRISARVIAFMVLDVTSTEHHDVIAQGARMGAKMAGVAGSTNLLGATWDALLGELPPKSRQAERMRALRGELDAAPPTPAYVVPAPAAPQAGSARDAMKARVAAAKEELRAAEASLEALRQAEYDARDAALFAEAQATGDLSKLPRCEHKCRCACPELPWAALVRAAAA